MSLRAFAPTMLAESVALGRPARLAPFAAVGVPAVAYLGTLLPGVGHSGDSAELSTCARLLAVPHSTGYPLYVVAAHLFGRLLPVDPARAANLFSTTCALLALYLLWLVLSHLKVGASAALASVWTLAAAPTFWEHAIVAEVYALHALLLAGSLLLFLRWADAGRERHFYAGCFIYALGFGNHLLMVTLLPALLVLVLRVRPGALVEPRRVLAVVAIVGLCALQYGFVFARAADGAAPYRAEAVNGAGDLLPFVTGAKFQHAMFAFSAAEILRERLPHYIESALSELAPLACFVPVGIVALGLGPRAAFLLLGFAGNLAFALSYDISDPDPYFIPNHLLGAVYLGIGLDALIRRLEAGSRHAARSFALLALMAPLGLGAIRLPRVVGLSGRDAAGQARAVLNALGPGTVIIAGYHDWQYLLYYKLVERRAPAGPYVADESVELGEVLAYLRDKKPLQLRQLGLSLPPGLELYSQALFAPKHYLRAGLTVEAGPADLYRIKYSKPDAP